MKARFISTAVLLFAIAGGLLGFRVREEHGFFREGPDGQCNIPIILNARTTITGGTLFALSVFPTTDPCPTIRLTEDE